jgi:hypothetical protein
VNLFTGVESTELFGGTIAPAAAHLIEVARNAPRDQAAAALWTAAVSAPDNLPVYYLLYKFHASLGELERAHEAAAKGLHAAARAAALPADWRLVQPGDTNFSVPGAARFWLFTLKALAFISLRRGDRDAALNLVAQLRRLDPADQLGASVVETLLQQSA